MTDALVISFVAAPNWLNPFPHLIKWVNRQNESNYKSADIDLWFSSTLLLCECGPKWVLWFHERKILLVKSWNQIGKIVTIQAGNRVWRNNFLCGKIMSSLICLFSELGKRNPLSEEINALYYKVTYIMSRTYIIGLALGTIFSQISFFA